MISLARQTWRPLAVDQSGILSRTWLNGRSTSLRPVCVGPRAGFTHELNDARVLACHEAAHAVACIVQTATVAEPSGLLDSVMSDGCHGVCKFWRFVPPFDTAVIGAAGPAASYKLTGVYDTSPSDWRNICGASDGAAAVRAMDRAAEIVEKHWPAITAVAFELWKKGELSGAEVASIVRRFDNTGV